MRGGAGGPRDTNATRAILPLGGHLYGRVRAMMSSDAKWTVTTGVALAGLVVMLALLLNARIDGINARIDSLDERLRAVETDAARSDERLNALERRTPGGENLP